MAEGTPDALKRTVGTDVIVAPFDSLTDATLACRAVPCPGWTRWWRRRDEVMVHADDGAAVMSPVALALHASGARPS